MSNGRAEVYPGIPLQDEEKQKSCNVTELSAEFAAEGNLAPFIRSRQRRRRQGIDKDVVPRVSHPPSADQWESGGGLLV